MAFSGSLYVRSWRGREGKMTTGRRQNLQKAKRGTKEKTTLLLSLRDGSRRENGWLWPDLWAAGEKENQRASRQTKKRTPLSSNGEWQGYFRTVLETGTAISFSVDYMDYMEGPSVEELFDKCHPHSYIFSRWVSQLGITVTSETSSN